LTLNLNEKIFKAYDIRGIAGKDLDRDIVKLIGKGFGTYLRQKDVTDVIVGHDNRPSCVEYHPALINGLTEVGCDVLDLGFSLSPMVYFARQHFEVDGAVMITASHNPPKYNGFKMCQGLNAIVEDEIQKVKNIIKSGKFSKGKGSIKKTEIKEAYFQAILDRVKLMRSFTVAVDCANATPGLFIPELLERMGCKVVPVFCELDSSFPNHLPDPVGLEYYGPLREAVEKITPTLE